MVRRRDNLFAMVCGLVIALVGVTTAGAAQSQPQTLQLNAQNNSGISGTATLSESGGRTRLELKVTGAGAGPEPAHIHAGSCAQLDPTPTFTLQPVSNGASSTEVNATVAMLTETPHAVHMHKSADELSVYVACADITPGSLPRTGDAKSPLSGPWLALAGLSSVVLGGLVVWRSRRRAA
ncbi:MAG TPA: LPXTG cell wall anchor domain-containing protein [Chloroflexota bacterium]|nr:LPXTG cell wall anchor domain-containing protein [Chloroflexota bacterium]